MDWQEINTQEDIGRLLEEYGNFHDSCITGLSYQSGSYVDAKLSMGMGELSDHVLTVTFMRQWEPVSLELCFVGVRRFHITGWQDSYFCDISDCHLAFHENLLPGEPSRAVVWADTDWFDPLKIPDSGTLKEPADSYVIAHQLKWRFSGKD